MTFYDDMKVELLKLLISIMKNEKKNIWPNRLIWVKIKL